MVPAKTALFQMFSARMRWLGQRQVVLGQNMANADTPDYQPHDLRGSDFARLARGLSAGTDRLGVRVTDPAHLDGRPVARIGLGGHPVETVFEVAPDGNAVVLEEQMAKASQTAMSYQLTSNLYRKYVGMVRTALGTQA